MSHLLDCRSPSHSSSLRYICTVCHRRYKPAVPTPPSAAEHSSLLYLLNRPPQKTLATGIQAYLHAFQTQPHGPTAHVIFTMRPHYSYYWKHLPRCILPTIADDCHMSSRYSDSMWVHVSSALFISFPSSRKRLFLKAFHHFSF